MSDVGELLQQFLHDHLALTRRQVEADRMIAASLAGHLVHELPDAEGRPADRPWRLDPVPLILDGGTFAALAAAITERLVGMEALLADLYGPRRAVKEGWVPAEVLASSSRYRWAAVGTPPPVRWLTSYAVDVLRLADGSWRVVRDLADTPTGVGYAMIDRAVMARVAAELLGPQAAGDLASISGFPSELRHALAGRAASAAHASWCSPVGSAIRPTSSTRRSLACSASTSSRRPTSSSVAVGCGCGRSGASTRSTSSTGASPTVRSTRSR